MCGIAGVFNRNGEPVDPDTLVRMTRTLVHRGPDDEGYFLNVLPSPSNAEFRGVAGGGDVGLGHRRLSIIDLATGQQPLCNEDGTVWVSYNGEIYNFQELKRELEAKGHRFRTHSDTETVVHAYEEWGERAAEHFRGMFALAVWDEREQKLWVARDRVGKKPFYYLIDENRFIFGSEIKAILQASDVPRDLDLEALSDYFSLLYVPSPKSIFSSIRKLPAGHQAVVTSGSFEVRSYWELPFTPQPGLDTARAAEELLEILDDATRMRMISEVPLGAFLSGGVDSSAIVSLMASASEQPVVTNSISFSVSAYNEAHHAQRVADLCHTDHQEFRVTPEAVSAIEQLAWNYDEPFADSSAIPTYYVSKTARGRVTVSLSGDGGDENFAGYRRYYFDQRENMIRRMFPDFLRRPLFGLLGHLYPKADYLPQVFRGKAFISNIARDPVDAYFFSVSAFNETTKPQILNGDVRRQLGGYQTAELFREIYHGAPAEDHLSRIQYLDIKTYLTDDILTKVDRASMAVSLEVRCPILDHVFMEYAAGIPASSKLVGTDGKHVFKKALKSRLPDDILYRRKMGFGVPILEWLRKDLSEYAEDLVLHGEATRQFLEPAYLRRLWSEHQKGLRNWSTELWIVMMLNLWFKKFGATSPG